MRFLWERKRLSAKGARGIYKQVHPWVHRSTQEYLQYILLDISSLEAKCKGNSIFSS